MQVDLGLVQGTDQRTSGLPRHRPQRVLQICLYAKVSRISTFAELFKLRLKMLKKMVLTCVRPYNDDRTSLRIHTVELKCVPVAIVVTGVVYKYVVKTCGVVNICMDSHTPLRTLTFYTQPSSDRREDCRNLALLYAHSLPRQYECAFDDTIKIIFWCRVLLDNGF